MTRCTLSNQLSRLTWGLHHSTSLQPNIDNFGCCRSRPFRRTCSAIKHGAIPNRVLGIRLKNKSVWHNDGGDVPSVASPQDVAASIASCVYISSTWTGEPIKKNVSWIGMDSFIFTTPRPIYYKTAFDSNQQKMLDCSSVYHWILPPPQRFWRVFKT